MTSLLMVFRPLSDGDNLLTLFCETTYILYTKFWTSHCVIKVIPLGFAEDFSLQFSLQDWSKTGWRQALTGSTQFSERPKQTQNCSRQVLESSSKVSYAGFNRLHTVLREAKTDEKLFQTGPRELQQGFICVFARISVFMLKDSYDQCQDILF